MVRDGRATIYFLDGSTLVIRYPRLRGKNSLAVMSQVRKAIEADQLAVEVNGNLLVVAMRSVKYIEISPVPDSLPEDVMRGGELVSGAK